MAGAAPATTATVKEDASHVAIVDEDGSVSQIAAKDLAAAQKEGARIATPEELRAEHLRAEYGDTSGEVKAALLGGARGLTLGLSDAAAVSLGGEKTRETLENYKEVNPTASLGGELVGAIAPVVLSGGAAAPEEGLALGRAASSAVRTAGAIPRGVAALGSAAERVAAGTLGEGNALARIAAGGVGAATEGAFYGGGQAISEAALGNEDLTAEKFLGHAGMGALFGGALGAGAGAIGEAAGAAAGAAGRGAARMALGAREGESLAQTLDRRSGELAWRSAGGTKAMASGAEKYAGGIDQVGRIWRDEAPSLIGKKSFGEMTREDLAAAAEKGLERSGQQLDSHLTQLDAAASKMGRQPRVGDVASDVEGIVAELEGRANTQAARAKLQAFADDIKRIGGMTDATGAVVNPDAAMPFKMLRDLRVDADKVWAGNSVDPNLIGFKAEFKKARDLLEDRLITEGDKVVAEAGGSFAKGYEAAKTKYQAFKLLERAAQSGVAGQARNRLLSLTDNIVGQGGASVGAMVGGALGGAPGAAVGGFLGGGAGAAINHVLRQRFDFVGSEVLGRLSHLARLDRANVAMDKRISDGVRGFLRPGGAVQAAPARLFGESRAERVKSYQAYASEVHELQANPAKRQARIAELLGPTAGVAPNTATAVAKKADAALAWLASTIHNPANDAFAPQKHLQKSRPPSDSAIEESERRLEAFLRPDAVLPAMRRGRATREAAETLRIVYPEMFQQVRTEIQTQLMDPTMPELSWEQQKQLSVLWDTPASEECSPEFTRDMQKSFATPSAQADQNPQAPAPQRPIDVDTDGMRSGTQDIERR